MATTKVSALAAKTSLAGSEELLINDGGTSKKVTATNLLAGVSVADGSISTAKIADDAVTEAKLANAINTAIAANTAKTSNATHTGDVTGATELTIASGAVETGMIADDAVTADKLANSINTEIAANTAKVTNATHTGDVTGATALTIAADAVTTAKILDDNVTAAKLANSINTDIATGVTANTTANAALPKAGGTMTGNIVMGDDTSIGIADDAERIEFDGAGDISVLGAKLGIGTDSPQNFLHIQSGNSSNNNYRTGADSPLIVETTGTSCFIEMVADSGQPMGMVMGDTSGSNDTASGAVIYDSNGDGLFFKSGGSTRFKINTDGKTIFNDGVIAKGHTNVVSNTGSLTLDFSVNQNFVITLTGNVTLANPSTEAVGQSGFITFIQDGTGSRTVGLGTDYETAGGAGLTLSSTASATDIVPYVVVASGRILLGTPQLAFA